MHMNKYVSVNKRNHQTSFSDGDIYIDHYAI